MEILTKLTKRNLKLNKKRTIGTIIGIVLSVALICALSGMFNSFQETLIQNAINERGNFHIALETINREQLSKYELNKDIKFISALYELGDSKYLNSSEDSPYITVYSINQEGFDTLSYTIIDGNFPKNSNEIVISKKMALQSKLKVGDYLELNIGTRKTKDGYKLGQYNPYQGEDKEYIDNPTYKKYKVVGISYRERNSSATYGITTNVENDNIHAYIALDNPKDYKQSFIELLNVDDYDDIRFSRNEELGFDFTINDELLRWQVFAFSDSTISMFTAIAAVVVTIIIIVSVFCIRNSFAISTTEKMKMYGMLASVGATKKQIKKSVILEGLILGLIGIPIGILCGFIAVFILIKIVNLLLGDFLFNSIDGIVFKMSIIPIIASVILGYLTIYLSSITSAKRASRVSPIENLRNTKDVKINANKLKTPKIISALFKTGGVIAYKNLKRSKKKYRTTVISLTVSIFVFIAMFSFINESFVMTDRYYTDYKYNVAVRGIRDYSEDEIKQLRYLDNINESYILYENRYFGKIKDKDKILYYNDSGLNEEDVSVDIKVVDSNSFKIYVEELGLNYNEVKDKGILIDDLRYWSETKEKEILGKRYSYKKGDIMNMKYSLESGDVNLSVELAEVTTKRVIGLENNYYNGGYLVLNKDYYEEQARYPYVLMYNSSNTEQLVKDIELIDYSLTISDLEKSVQTERAMLLVISIFLYGFIGVITLIGVTNIFNTITSNMELRQKEFAMLKSVGMTKKEFNRMINLETLFYSAKSLCYGITLGLIGSYIIHLAFSKNVERAFTLPLTAIIISIIFVFIIVYIIMKYSINKINKQNTIETIRNENI